MKISSKLIKAYRETDFIFFPDNGISTLKIGKKNKVLDSLLKSLGCSEAAYITPWNPKSKTLSFSANKKRMNQFIKHLNSKKYKYIYGIGRSKDGKYFEDSVLILDISKKDSLSLGIKFRQNAIVTYQKNKKAELIFCFS